MPTISTLGLLVEREQAGDHRHRGRDAVTVWTRGPTPRRPGSMLQTGHRRRRTLRQAPAGLAGRNRRSGLVRPRLDHQPPFDTPETGKIAVEVINHYGDEVLKVFDVEPSAVMLRTIPPDGQVDRDDQKGNRHGIPAVAGTGPQGRRHLRAATPSPVGAHAPGRICRHRARLGRLLPGPHLSDAIQAARSRTRRVYHSSCTSDTKRLSNWG